MSPNITPAPVPLAAAGPSPATSRQRARRKSPESGADIRIERTATPTPTPPSAGLRFGRVFTDHMFLSEHRDRTWHDPRVVPFAPLPFNPAAAGLHYGQSLFEGCKAFRGVDGKLRLFRLDRHLARLARSAARLCMPSPPASFVARAIAAVVAVDARFVPAAPGCALYLRPTLIATEAFLGVRPAQQYLFFVIASPVASYFGTDTGPLRLKIEETYVRAALGGLGAVKAAANYAASLRAAEDARAEGFDQVLWTDALEHSALEEAGTMNVFVRIGDEISTPPLRGTILAGVTRESVIALLARDGRRVRERAVTAIELLEARRTGRLHEMFGTGTGAGIAPIGELSWRGERIVVGDGGEGQLARRLMPMLREIQTGAAADPDGWMTEVSALATG